MIDKFSILLLAGLTIYILISYFKSTGMIKTKKLLGKTQTDKDEPTTNTNSTQERKK